MSNILHYIAASFLTVIQRDMTEKVKETSFNADSFD